MQVSVNVKDYSVIKYWVLGKEASPLNHSLYKRITKYIQRQPLNKSETVYKRVISAVRLKKEDKLTLKAFKDIAVTDLEKVLPTGTIKIGKFDRYVIVTSVAFGSLALLAKFVTFLAKMSVNWPLGFAAVAGLLGGKAYWAYRSRKNKYLYLLNKTLYYKNIANNRGLITLVIDRAQDESFKEALLTYTFVQALNRKGGDDLLHPSRPSGMNDCLYLCGNC